MKVWIETTRGIIVFERARSAYQKNNVVQVIDQHGVIRVLDGTLKHCALS
ncbi:hypothetical protein LCGC14_1041130 [marine sediment metagenome]|uniref:Uncharacterized protein n=1 Tax=marine sediment metagenome TaxID=412755 RepID=A0A0F9MRJ0_9ZZZZ